MRAPICRRCLCVWAIGTVISLTGVLVIRGSREGAARAKLQTEAEEKERFRSFREVLPEYSLFIRYEFTKPVLQDKQRWKVAIPLAELKKSFRQTCRFATSNSEYIVKLSRQGDEGVLAIVTQNGWLNQSFRVTVPVTDISTTIMGTTPDPYFASLVVIESSSTTHQDGETIACTPE